MAYFPGKLKELRTEKGLSQMQLAKILNVSQNAIYNWENGKREPNSDMIEKIATYFSVSPSLMMGWEKIDQYFSGRESKEAEEKFAATIEKHHSSKAKMDIAFGVLNEIGQNKAVEYVEDLTKITEYRKK